MKELSIEEKARRYDVAVEELRGLLEGIHEEKCDIMEEDIIKIFPELKGNDDERIRKELLNAFQESEDSLYMVLTPHRRESFITWLEKQGEQNLVNTDLDELVIQLEETIGTSPHSRETIKDFFQKAAQKYMNCLKIASGEIESLIEENYRLKEKQGEKKPVFEMKTPEESLGIDSETYNKIVDECVYGEQNPAEWIQELESKLSNATPEQLAEWKEKYFKVEPAWSEEDERFLNVAINILNSSKVYTKSPDKYEDTINWLKDLKDRVQPQPKQEWSKEDEINRDLLYNALNQVYDMEHNKDLSNWINKRILLCSQQQWKPSDEQIKGIECAIKTLRLQLNVGDKRLNSLYDALKKLS